MLPRADDQLVTPGRLLAGHHRSGRAPAVPGVLQLGVVESLAVLEDVELAADHVRRDAIRDDPREDVLSLPPDRIPGASDF